jgi:hypothetical protein
MEIPTRLRLSSFAYIRPLLRGPHAANRYAQAKGQAAFASVTGILGKSVAGGFAVIAANSTMNGAMPLRKQAWRLPNVCSFSPQVA